MKKLELCCHQMTKFPQNGNDKPLAFASQTLATAEWHYSQLDKESLAVVFGVKKFHQYLCGRQFYDLINNVVLV